VDESFTQYRPQFSDESAPRGEWFYRVSATNSAGGSRPSNVVGPVRVDFVTRVDELADFARTHSRSGSWEIKSRDCRAAMEDAHRAAGTTGDTLVYQVPKPLQAAAVWVFFPKALTDPRFSVSADGLRYRNVPAARQDFPHGAGDYGYWRRAIYRVAGTGREDRWLRIELTAETQISRVEMQHEAAAP
jgi:hypothetical protein